MTNAPRFRLEAELGLGATGRVWRGVLTEPFGPYPAGFAVAVKYLHPELEEDPRARRAFEAEEQAGSATLHPGIVHVIASSIDGRGHFLVMPFVPGESLRDVLAREADGNGGNRALPEPLVRQVARQVSGGLLALHAAGFVHGDVKPENIRLDAEGNAVLMDLGFARRDQGDGGSGDVRAVAPRPGSLAYLAPEQARGEAGSRKSDVFALGVVVFELATGAHPFFGFARTTAAGADRVDGASTALPHAHPHVDGAGSSGLVARVALEKPDADKLIAAIATARFTAPSRIVPQISPFLDRLLQDVLQRDPVLRPDAAEFHRRLVEQETGAWWRGEIGFEAGARRGGTGETDARHLTPLVGREEILEQLLAAYEQAAPGAAAPIQSGVSPPATDVGVRSAPIQVAESPQTTHTSDIPPPAQIAGGAVWLRGPAGMGKSRLVNELAARARASDDPPIYLYGRCRELDEERPCQPFLRMLERWLRLPPNVAPREREVEELEKLVPPRVAHTLVQALDHGSGDKASLSVPLALATWLTTLARRVPLLVCLDDVNWAAVDTLDVLAHVAERMKGARMLLVIGERSGARDDLRPEAAGRATGQLESARARLASQVPLATIALEPLGEVAVEALVRRMFHHSSPRLRLAHVLWQRSRGNPGLVVEILRGLITRGDVRVHPENGGGLDLLVSPDDLPLPGSLRKAIAESYRRLPASDRTWLRRLAVVGGRIETDFLLRAFPDAKRADVDSMLTRLSRSGWLAPTGARYRFARPALREAVYRGLSREQRLKLHAAAAAALVPAEGEALTLERAFQRAFHLRAAGDHATLLHVLRPLLGRLLKSGQPQRVHPLAQWGLEAIEKLEPSRENDRTRIDLLEAAADAADRLGIREDQRTILDRLSDLELDPDQDAESIGRVYLLHGRYAVSTGQYGLARGMLRNATLMFTRAGAELERSEALRRLALVQSHVGELSDARKLAEQALETSQTGPQRALAHLALGVIDVLGDRVEPALANADRALSILRADSTRELPGVLGTAYMLRARIYRSSGTPARALASANRAVDLARVAGERRLEAEAMARLGGLLLDVDRVEEAEARLREALLLSEEIEDRRGQSLSRLFLGILLWEQNDPEAPSMLARARELAVEMGLNRVEALAAAIRSRIFREKGETGEALSWSGRSMDLLERFGAELADRIAITGTRSLVLSGAGRETEADALADEMRARIGRDNARIKSPLLRLRHRRAAERLLDAVLSPEGPVYPRIQLPEEERAG